MGEFRRNFTLAELIEMGFDIRNLKRVRKQLNDRAKSDPLEKDACTVPLISDHVASRVAENFGLPFSGIQDNANGQDSAMATMFIRMNSEAYFYKAQQAAAAELEVYQPSIENGGFLFQLDKWISDRHRFLDSTDRTSALIGGSILLQLIRTQLGYEFVDRMNQTSGSFNAPANVISGKEWMAAFDSVFPNNVDRTNPIGRMRLPRIPREQIAVADLLEKARLVTPSPEGLIDGTVGVYSVLDRNWKKLKLR